MNLEQRLPLPPIPTQKVNIPLKNGIEIYVKREDKTHWAVSGNKYRKLKYNLLEAEKQGIKKVLTFGGAYSNHIAATAAVAQIFGFEAIGIIRGEELAQKPSQNPTLHFAQNCGMQLHFVSRSLFREKEQPHFIADLQQRFGDFYYVPEGGTNALGIRGCEEILSPQDAHYDVITTAVGTGGTLTGLINSSGEGQQVLGFPALKGDFLTQRIQGWTNRKNWALIHDYHFGGYAKTSEELIIFLNDFHQKTGIALDPVYTGKMMYGLFHLIDKDYFPPQTQILAIHTGGLQGIAGMNEKLTKQHKTILTYANQLD